MSNNMSKEERTKIINDAIKEAYCKSLRDADSGDPELIVETVLEFKLDDQEKEELKKENPKIIKNGTATYSLEIITGTIIYWNVERNENLIPETVLECMMSEAEKKKLEESPWVKRITTGETIIREIYKSIK